MKHLISCLKGTLVGFTSILPGVSGSLSAVILGIYERLVTAVSDFLSKPLKTLKDHYDLILGIMLGVFVGALTMDYLYQTIPIPLMMFFAGIIAGSLPRIFKTTAFPEKPQTTISLIAVTFLLFVLFVSLSERADHTSGLSFFRAFLVGIPVAAALLIPGLSAATMLVVLGAYPETINLGTTFIRLMSSDSSVSPNTFLTTILGLLLGSVIGLFLVAKGITYVLRHYPKHVMAVVFGLALASIYTLVNMSLTIDYEHLETHMMMVIAGIILFIIGTFLSYMLSKIAKKELST